MVHLLARLAVLGDHCQRTTEEVDTHQCRFTALPSDRYLGAGLRLEQLAYVGFQYLVGHTETVARVERLLGQEEAVFAIEVADRPARLREDMERRGRRHRPGFAHEAILTRPRRAMSPRKGEWIPLVVERSPSTRRTFRHRVHHRDR